MADRYEGYRDENGRLLPGHVGGPGRPSRTREAEIYQGILSIFDEDTMQRFIAAQQKRLGKGDTASVRELLKFVLPTKARTEHTGADGEPLLPISQVIAALQELERQQKAGETGEKPASTA